MTLDSRQEVFDLRNAEVGIGNTSRPGVGDICLSSTGKYGFISGTEVKSNLVLVPVMNDVCRHRFKDLGKDLRVPLRLGVPPSLEFIGKRVHDNLVLAQAGFVVIWNWRWAHEAGNRIICGRAVLRWDETEMLYADEESRVSASH